MRGEAWKRDLEAHAARVHSQGGEDGVLLRLFERVGIRHRYFVEFGAWDGLHLSNTANLRRHHGWRGLLMEGSDRADGELVRREHVDAENIEALLARYDVPLDFDLLSIDIDGNDYWVWRALETHRPSVVLVEYNVFFLAHQARTIVYDRDHVWDKERYGTYHGASLAAFVKLGRRKGYSLVYTDLEGPNAIFLRDDLVPRDVEIPPAEAWTRWAWPPADWVEPAVRPGGAWVDV